VTAELAHRQVTKPVHQHEVLGFTAGDSVTTRCLCYSWQPWFGCSKLNTC